AVYAALGRLAAHLLGGALDPLRENVAEALAIDDHLQQAVGAFGIAPLESEPDLLLGEGALLHALHHPAAHPAELVDIHAGAVGPRVEPGDGVLVGDAERPAGARPALVLGVVDQLAGVGPAPDHLDVAVPHPARAALVSAVVEAVPELRRFPFRHVRAGEGGRVVLRSGEHT